MKAIRTTYYGPTDTRGSRFRATDGDGNVITVPYDYALDAGANHAVAAEALCRKLGWSLPVSRGWFKNECYHTFEVIERDNSGLQGSPKV